MNQSKHIFHRVLSILMALCFPVLSAFSMMGEHPVLIISSYNPDARQTSGNISDFIEEFQRLGGKNGVVLRI